MEKSIEIQIEQAENGYIIRFDKYTEIINGSLRKTMRRISQIAYDQFLPTRGDDE